MYNGIYTATHTSSDRNHDSFELLIVLRSEYAMNIQQNIEVTNELLPTSAALVQYWSLCKNPTVYTAQGEFNFTSSRIRHSSAIAFVTGLTLHNNISLALCCHSQVGCFITKIITLDACCIHPLLILLLLIINIIIIWKIPAWINNHQHNHQSQSWWFNI